MQRLRKHNNEGFLQLSSNGSLQLDISQFGGSVERPVSKSSLRWTCVWGLRSSLRLRSLCLLLLAALLAALVTGRLELITQQLQEKSAIITLSLSPSLSPSLSLSPATGREHSQLTHTATADICYFHISMSAHVQPFLHSVCMCVCVSILYCILQKWRTFEKKKT